ncbi:hypothetical protein C7M84_006011 [Penaeus vannamei]|uniref:Peptidase A2 domain-containing protein n=1 Tax=Penaeus vannamei TaxID=6689 RepID=A0A3R7M827_PENVA|nr:hypothetical protein C7M84_006011 [Penaeus vannamei]
MNGMTERQAPMDFFLEVEASVFQGYRDHRGAVGEPSELIRRVFLAGLPSTLRDLLVLKDDCSPIQLAETAQKLWNSSMASGTAVPTLATSLRTTSKRTTTSFDVALQTGHLVLETVMTCSLLPPHRHLLSLFPRLQHHGVMYGVNIIEVQPTAPGNAELLRVSLHRQPILVSVVEGAVTCLVSAPFREARKEGFPTSLATLQEGTHTRSIAVQTEPVQTAAVTTPAVGGRPVVALSVDGKTLLCFIDTGSQVTLVKPSALEVIDPAKKLRHYASSKILQGVSGEPFHPAAEVTLSLTISPDLVLLHRTIVADLSFHGDVLLGTDFLRRQDFTLQSEAQSPHGLLILGGWYQTRDCHTFGRGLQCSPLHAIISPVNLPETAARDHAPPVRTGPENSTTEKRNDTQPRVYWCAAAARQVSRQFRMYCTPRPDYQPLPDRAEVPTSS